MAFDWLAFLDKNGVPYQTRGHNTSRNNITINCVFCGDDSGSHLSVNLLGRGYRCWRNNSHKGTNAGLVAALLRCSYEEANSIVSNTVDRPSNLLDAVQRLVNVSAANKSKRALVMPSEFKLFTGLPSSGPFTYYMRQRGFDNIKTLSKRYDVRYCLRGPFANRIIFPVYQDRKLVCWTGRTTVRHEMLRYKALTVNAESAKASGLQPALLPISHALLWQDLLNKSDAHTLVLNEGPFDALKINYLGRKHGIIATCFFTSAPTEQQVMLLRSLAGRFKRRVLLLDEAAMAASLQTASRLAALNIETLQLPPDVKDPGEIASLNQLLQILH